MKCIKCNAELTEGSLFCNNCGTNQKESINDSNDDQLISDAGHKMGFHKEKNKTSNKMIFIITTVIAFTILLAFLIIVVFSNPVDKFINKVKANSYIEASKIYNEQIVGKLEKEKELEAEIVKLIESIKNDFYEDKTNYEDSVLRLETIQKTETFNVMVSDAMEYITLIKDSRFSFEKGMEFKNSNKLEEAIDEFGKVSEDDVNNYKVALEEIKQLKEQYRSLILEEINEYVKKEQYSEALQLIESVTRTFIDDVQISVLKDEIVVKKEEKDIAERKALMEKYFNEQELSVVSAKLKKTGYYIDFYHIEVVVSNKTKKVVKRYDVGMIAFDENNYPLKIEDSSYLKNGYADGVNIQPGANYGSNTGWDLYGDNEERIKTVMACVEKVEYYDGTVWENPYYELWVEEYSEKPLH